MSRMSMLAAALVVCWGVGATCLAEENPPASQVGDVPAKQASSDDLFESEKVIYELTVTATTPGSATTTAAEEIERALKKPVDLHFVDTPLSDVVDYCAEHLDINIRLDPQGMTDAAIDSSAPITFSTHKPITFESALNLILEEFGLTFAMQNEVLSITSKDKADEILTTEVHYVGDLVIGSPSKLSNYKPLMSLITSTVRTGTWDDNGGSGSIQPFLATCSLVFSQKRDVHAEVADLLAKVRQELKEHEASIKAQNETFFSATYYLGNASGEEVAEAIKKLISPSTWQGSGGEGEISIAKRFYGGVHAEVLFIRQTASVHGQIADLVSGFTSTSDTMNGKGTIGGGAGKGGGMFRVPDSH